MRAWFDDVSHDFFTLDEKERKEGRERKVIASPLPYTKGAFTFFREGSEGKGKEGEGKVV